MKRMLVMVGFLLLVMAGTADRLSAAITCAAGERTFTFTNMCSETIWIGATGGGEAACGQPGNTCPSGQACNDTTGLCYFVLPAPSAGDWNLAAKGGTATFCLPAPASPGVQWSGNVFGRTGCDSNGNNCQTANCGVGGSQCPAGVGGTPPATLAEFTLQTNATDFYDVSIINGVNIAIEMAPTGSFGSAPSGTGADYWCGNPGGPKPSNAALKGCTWDFDPVIGRTDDGTYLQYVSSGGSSCSSNSDCSGGEVCGLASNLQRSCGTPIGWWSADQVCGTNSEFGAPFNCGLTVPAANGNYGTLTNMYGCVLNEPGKPHAKSCYTVTDDTCCGCPPWGPATSPCLATNSFWQTNVLPFAQFLKQACPTAYSFPYDDKTSTFQCQSAPTTSPNQVGYAITYCPPQS